MGIKERLKRLEGTIPDGYQETLDFLKLSWKIKCSSPQWPAPTPEVMMNLETRAKSLVNQGEILSIKELLKKIDGEGKPRPMKAAEWQDQDGN